jgi:pyruvate dehydrogenase E2 component (dihydrolipoamide acetyltransferase)
MADFVMPALGADMQAGTLLTWLKQPGDEVARGEIIAVVHTDKADVEVEVFTSGVIERLLVEPGAEVPVGTALAVIREDGAPPAPAPAHEAPPAAAPPAAAARIEDRCGGIEEDRRPLTRRADAAASPQGERRRTVSSPLPSGERSRRLRRG